MCDITVLYRITNGVECVLCIVSTSRLLPWSFNANIYIARRLPKLISIVVLQWKQANTFELLRKKFAKHKRFWRTSI